MIAELIGKIRENKESGDNKALNKSLIKLEVELENASLDEQLGAAQAIKHMLDDDELVRDILKLAQNTWHSTSSLIAIAKTINIVANDKEWLNEIYTNIEENLDYTSDYIEFSKAMVDIDENKSETMLMQAAEIANDFDDFQDLGIYLANFKGITHALPYFIKCEEEIKANPNSGNEYFLITALTEYMEDETIKNIVKRVSLQWFNNEKDKGFLGSIGFGGFVSMADNVVSITKDRHLAELICSKIDSFRNHNRIQHDDSSEYRVLADSLTNLKDKDMARKYYKKAITHLDVNESDEYKSIEESIENYMDSDRELLKLLYSR